MSLVGTVTDSTINAGGNEFLNAGTTAIDTIINAGGVQSGPGTAIGTLINEGGLQNVSGIVKGTIINGGVESVSNGGMADGVTFAGSHSTLALATPSGLTGFIRNWHVGDIIDFQNTIVTGVNATSNTLTVTYGDHQTASYSLAGQQANAEFKLQSDGNGGTELVLFASSLGAPPFSPEIAATIVYTAELGIAPSATELSGLTEFTQAQFAYGQQIGVDAGIYAFTALGVTLASGGQHFQNEFGSGNSAYPNSTAGDAKFVTDAYGSVFGHAGSTGQVQHFVDQLNFYEGIYTAAGLARGAVYGQMLGVEHEITPVGGQPVSLVGITPSVMHSVLE
jgi:autotransporter passenger strand-loop-strand repeat protein